MKLLRPLVLPLSLALAGIGSAADRPAIPSYPRPLRELYTDYFPLHHDGPITAESWGKRRQEIRDRVLLAAGLFPLPTKTPLNAVIHGRVERDDYVIDRVFFESFPGHYVTGSLYRPKNPPAGGRMPGVLSPHGHWKDGRFFDNGPGTKATKQLLAIGAERFENGARSHLQARSVQLARMGCAVFLYDALGYADSIQITEHRTGRRDDLNGRESGTYGLFAAMADLRLQSSFGLQTWNSIRALDFLLTLPGIDATRISCTGASGGGTQTMILAAVDDRLTTAFPCVMVSTAMQGGCTCENANYLRINQGNIDIAAAFAPKPMGMTAADDWTKELATKGFPDLKRIWTMLGKPDDVVATFNTHWGHNYNHVSRTTMYGFMNRHFKLGFSEPVLERDFGFSTREETTVWSGAHAKPSGDRVGAAHEKALLKHWSDDSDRLISGRKDLLVQAWNIIVGRAVPAEGDASLVTSSQQERGGHVVITGAIHDRRHREEVPITIARPAGTRWNGTVAVWVADGGAAAVDRDGTPSAAAQRLLDAGIAIACPTLYLAGAKEQPLNPVKSRDASRRAWDWSACYTYGYNHPLPMHRVHDVMNVVAALKADAGLRPSRIVIAGGSGAGAIAAAAAATLSGLVHGAVIDTEGFRFAKVDHWWDPMFVPGAVKYGDVPGLLRLCESLNPVVLGEAGAKGGTDEIASAVLRVAGQRGRTTASQ